MRFATYFAVLLLVVLSMAAPARAVIVLEAVCGSAPQMTVQITGNVDPTSYPGLVGFDVYRRSRPLVGGSEERITPDPIPFAGGALSLSLPDPGAQSNLVYEYQVVGVDANRQLIDVTNEYWTYDWTSCGDAPLALIRAQFVAGRWTHGPACGDCCGLYGFPGITYQLPAQVQSLIDIGFPAPILLVGTVINSPAHMHGPWTDIRSWAISDCETVDVESTAWSEVKQLYR